MDLPRTEEELTICADRAAERALRYYLNSHPAERDELLARHRAKLFAANGLVDTAKGTRTRTAREKRSKPMDKQLARTEEEGAISGGTISGFDDSSGNIGPMEFYEVTTQFLRRLPLIAGVCTKAEVAVVLKELFGDAPRERR